MVAGRAAGAYPGPVMPSSAAAVEARILANPDDASAWQAYVPWLRVQDDPRAEWIALAAYAETPLEREWLTAQLAREHPRWTPSAVWTDDCVFRHGFAIAATIRIGNRSDARGVARLLDDRRARLLRELRLVFHDTAPARGLDVLEEASFARLRVLRAAYHGRGNRVLRALARQPALNLEVLDLRHAGVTDEGLAWLADCTALFGVRALHLQHNRFTGRGVAALAASPVLTGVEELDLRHNAIGEAGAAALSASPHLGAVTALRLHAGEIEAAGVRALASSTTLPRDLVRLWRAQTRP